MATWSTALGASDSDFVSLKKPSDVSPDDDKFLRDYARVARDPVFAGQQSIVRGADGNYKFVTNRERVNDWLKSKTGDEATGLASTAHILAGNRDLGGLRAHIETVREKIQGPPGTAGDVKRPAGVTPAAAPAATPAAAPVTSVTGVKKDFEMTPLPPRVPAYGSGARGPGAGAAPAKPEWTPLKSVAGYESRINRINNQEVTEVRQISTIPAVTTAKADLSSITDEGWWGELVRVKNEWTNQGVKR